MHKLFLTLATAVFLESTSFSGEPAVKIEHGWVQAVPPSSSDTAAYLTLTNVSDKPLRLTGGSTSAAETLMLMVTTNRNVDGTEIIGMKGVNELIIPAHGQLALAPDGDHLMLMMLKKHPMPGDKVQLTLHFEPGGKNLATELPVSLTRP